MASSRKNNNGTAFCEMKVVNRNYCTYNKYLVRNDRKLRIFRTVFWFIN